MITRHQIHQADGIIWRDSSPAFFICHWSGRNIPFQQNRRRFCFACSEPGCVEANEPQEFDLIQGLIKEVLGKTVEVSSSTVMQSFFSDSDHVRLHGKWDGHGTWVNLEGLTMKDRLQKVLYYMSYAIQNWFFTYMMICPQKEVWIVSCIQHLRMPSKWNPPSHWRKHARPWHMEVEVLWPSNISGSFDFQVTPNKPHTVYIYTHIYTYLQYLQNNYIIQLIQFYTI